MKLHVTNHKHQQFILLIDDTLHKIEEKKSVDDNRELTEKITELQNNKLALQELYSNYQFKLKELSTLLDEYTKTQQTTRINLRRIQLWLKFSTVKLVNGMYEDVREVLSKKRAL